MSSPKVEHFKLTRQLKEALEEYGEVTAEFKEQLINYLLTGEDATFPLAARAALSSPIKPFFKLQHGTLQATSGSSGKKLAAIFRQVHVPAGYYRRLGELVMAHPLIARYNINGDDRLPQWVNTILRIYQLLSGNHYYGAQIDPNTHILPWARELTDAEIGKLIAVLVDAETGDHSHIGRMLLPAIDLTGLLAANTGHLCLALKSATASAIESTLQLLLMRQFDCAALLPTLVDLLGSSKKVNLVASQLIAKHASAAQGLLLDKLTSGDSAQRNTVAELLAEIYRADVLPQLKAAAKDEKGGRVKQTLDTLITRLESELTPQLEPTAEIVLPPIQWPEDPIALPDGFRVSFQEYLSKTLTKFVEQYDNRRNQPDTPYWMRNTPRPEQLSDKELAELFDYLEGNSNKKPRKNQWVRNALLANGFEQCTGVMQLHLLHLLRLMQINDLLHISQYGMTLQHPQLLNSHRQAQTPPYGLRELNLAIELVFGRSDTMVTSYLGHARWQYEWEPEAIWPLFHERQDELRNAILGISKEKHDFWIHERRRMAIEVAGQLPRLPREIENAIWAIALGEAKTDRPLARRALNKAAGRLERGLQAITDGKQSIRVAGAELLGELRDPAAVEPLKRALKSEKQEAVKGSLLQAIELLGGDVEEFLGRRKQLLDAKKALEKKRPKGMEWFPIDALPQVRWAEDDKPVAPEIVQWWVIQSIQFKLPTCGAILRRAIAMCRPDDAAVLAKFVLSAWIGHDTQVANPEQSLAAATARAKKEFSSVSWIREYYKTEEAYRDEILRQIQGTFLNSAIGEKGALAVVAAGGDKHCARMIEKFIRTHHGHRLAQSKALLEVLGWIDDPLAIQILLSIGNRFRTAAIRKRAAEIVKEIADRKGWSMEELADRTIPDAGFLQEKDEAGRPIGKRAELVLDYGSRKFIVILNDDLEPVISRDDGKEVKALPAAAKDDDPELVKVAKAEFTAAKKTVKDVVKLLGEQLYEAVCAGRTWNAATWRTYLALHPIAGALCRRVIWRAHPVDKPEEAIFFRPLEDGSLTDVNDDPVELADDDVVSVAHSSLMSSQQEQAWITHLQDYEVPRLFPQFGRPAFRLDDQALQATEIDACRGHMLSTFQLRNKATKLGWQRGAAQDGGSFSHYFKPFRSAGITAMLEFTGSFVPEQDIPAAIRSLYFVLIQPTQDDADTWNPPKMKLGKVPIILISECYNDMRDIAAEGTGFDPEWEKKGLW